MRVSREAREKTRRRIVAEARELFATKGFPAVRTREVAAAAGVAAGTLFNYFASKEELAGWIVAEAAREGSGAFRGGSRKLSGLSADLVGHGAAVLRSLEPCRGFLIGVLGSARGPVRYRAGAEGGATDRFRTEHLSVVTDLLIAHGRLADAVPMTLHLYWTLFLGVLAFWAADETPRQQDTMELLERSADLFVQSLDAGA